MIFNIGFQSPFLHKLSNIYSLY